MTRHDAIKLALTNYANVLGTVIEVNEVHGYTGNDSATWRFDEPIRVVVISTDGRDVANVVEDWCDCFVESIWNVEIFEECLKSEHRRDGVLPADARSFWVYGPDISMVDFL